ncbi:Major facilitator superfamily protein [Perilla frutescens var. frutescens]|nr:Major facilitator superfamily protein [Perilla frutescens var. frutescens]
MHHTSVLLMKSGKYAGEVDQAEARGYSGESRATAGNGKAVYGYDKSLEKTQENVQGCMGCNHTNLTKGELQIDAHRSPMITMVFSSNGTYIPTASKHGTIIRVHLISYATKVSQQITIYAIAGPVTGHIISELSSSRTRGKFMGFSFCVHWVFNFLAGLFFLELIEKFGVAPVYAGFGGVSTLATAPFLSLNLDALAEQLAKAKLSERLYLQSDLLPLELVGMLRGLESDKVDVTLAPDELEVLSMKFVWNKKWVNCVSNHF